MTYAVIPAKGFTGAKQRLATFLEPHERRVLARAMLTDTLTACSQATGLDGVGVVTCERDVADVALSAGHQKARPAPMNVRCSEMCTASLRSVQS